MSREKNSWLKRINRRIMDVGERVGRPIRKPIEKHFEVEERVRNMMSSKGLVGGTMGDRNYDIAFKKIKGLVKDNNIQEANKFISGLSKK